MLQSLLFRSRKKGHMPEDLGLQKAGCCRAKMPLGGSARCEVPAEPALRPPRLGDFQSTCIASTAQQMVGKRRRVNISLNLEWFCDATAFIAFYCNFSSGVCEVDHQFWHKGW